MDVSVETLKGLERKLTVKLPAEDLEEKVAVRLRDLARRVKIDGFRPGKAPMMIVKSRYADGVREEVAYEMIRTTLDEALNQQALMPAGAPSIEVGKVEPGQDFSYTASFEVFPEISIIELTSKNKISIVEAVVGDADVDEAIEKLREQNKKWVAVDRPVSDGDKINLDFTGYLGDEAFQGGQARGHEFIVGSGSMIPDFEKGMLGATKGTPFEIKVQFPEDYSDKNLAGKETRFEIQINEIMEGQLPALDEAFIKQFNMKDKGLAAFKEDIKENMVRELERRVQGMNRESIFDELMAVNALDIPKALIDLEIENLKHELYHNLFGHEHKEDEKIPDFPRHLFEDRARRRVHLGLLFSKYVETHKIVADPSRVDLLLEKLASAYEDPEEFRKWYRNKEQRADLEGLVLEEMVAEKISETAKLVKTKKTYAEVMYPKQAPQDQDDKKGE